jgi:RimJ/RimL family protein N-acetyltransferase
VTDSTPLYGLRLRTPRLELRLGSHEELHDLGRLAERGIHPPDEMPFSVAWTDAFGSPGYLEDFVRHHVSALTDWWSCDAWRLNLLVWSDDALVGSQSVAAECFPTERRVHTGSWLGSEHQGRGIGTEMRAAVLELAFRGLGATVAESSSLEGNEQSRRVSEKLGYRTAGHTEHSPRGAPVHTTIVELERHAWRSPVTVEIEGLEACLGLFGVDPGASAQRTARRAAPSD